MLASAPGYVLDEWQEYYRLEPFGPERSDLQIGQIAALLFNYLRKPSAKPLKPADFLLNTKFDPPAAQTAEGQIAAARVAAAASSHATSLGARHG